MTLLEHCSIPCSAVESLNTLWPISQQFLNGFSWNFSWLLFRWKGSSLDLKQWPCSFSVQCSAAESSSQPFFNQLVTPVVGYSNCSDFFSNSSVKTTKVFKLQQDGFVSHCQHFSHFSTNWADFLVTLHDDRLGCDIEVAQFVLTLLSHFMTIVSWLWHHSGQNHDIRR